MLVRQWFSNFTLLKNHLGNLLKISSPKAWLLIYQFCHEGRESASLTGNPGNSDAGVLGPYFEKHCNLLLQMQKSRLPGWQNFPTHHSFMNIIKIELYCSNHTKDPLWITLLIPLWLTHLMLNCSWNWVSLIFVKVRKILLNHIQIWIKALSKK